MKIAVLDIETTGFLAQGGKIVEIGIAELNLVTGETLPLYDSLIKEDGLDESHTEGKYGWIFKNSDLKFEELLDAPSLESQREEVQSILDKYQVTAYNKAFDFGFLRDRGFTVKDLPCPMLLSTPICKIQNARGYKWPKVEEAWEFFFGKETGYVEAHRGYDDAAHEAKIVYALFRMGEFQLPEEFYQSGIGMIMKERIRQIKEKGWTPAHDAKYQDGELAIAAFCYYTNNTTETPTEWPWEHDSWKLSNNPIKNKVKSGALYQAEIDRLTRKARTSNFEINPDTMTTLLFNRETVVANIDEILENKIEKAETHE